MEKEDQDISLINRFIASEFIYKEIGLLFKTEGKPHNWTDSQHMIDFFKSFETFTSTQSDGTNEQSVKTNLKYERLLRGYFDDQLNTDQAWKEVELWHFHYCNTSGGPPKHRIDKTLIWRTVNEFLFSGLSQSQSHVIEVIANKLKHKMNIN